MHVGRQRQEQCSWHEDEIGDCRHGQRAGHGYAEQNRESPFKAAKASLAVPGMGRPQDHREAHPYAGKEIVEACGVAHVAAS